MMNINNDRQALLLREVQEYLDFSCILFNTASSAAPQLLCAEDARIEPRTVAMFAESVRRSNRSG